MAIDSNKRIIVFTATISLIILLIGLIFELYGFEAILNSHVQSEMNLDNGSLAFDIWQGRKGLTLNVYFFNITNPQEILTGSRPVFKRIGPYVYDELISKVSVTEGPDDTWRYFQKYESYFNDQASKRFSDADVISTIDFALIYFMSLHQRFPEEASKSNVSMQSFFGNKQSPFMKNSVKNILFDGYEWRCDSQFDASPLSCNSVLEKSPKFAWASQGGNLNFALFHYRNKTNDIPFTAYRGIKSSDRLSHIASYGGKRDLSNWDSPYCNMMNGSSDGLNYPTNYKEDRVYFFNAEFCRSMWAKFRNITTKHGVKLRRYSTSKNLFGATEHNRCFCPKRGDGLHCPPHGSFSLEQCDGSPFLITLPMFLYGDKQLYRDAFRKEPTEPSSAYTTLVEIEPLTGIPFKVIKRSQINVKLEPVRGISYMKDIVPMVYPILWFEEISAIDSYDAAEIMTNLHLYSWLHSFVYAAIVSAVGIILLLCGAHLKFESKWCIDRTKDEEFCDPAMYKHVRDDALFSSRAIGQIERRINGVDIVNRQRAASLAENFIL